MEHRSFREVRHDAAFRNANLAFASGSDRVPTTADFLESAMVKRKQLESNWPAALDITLVPAAAHLPAAVRVERRNLAVRHALMQRIHSEFEEMPGLSLTVSQAGKIFGLHVEIIGRILERLSDTRVLRRRNDGQFTLHVGEG
jgi:hypothetical protein